MRPHLPDQGPPSVSDVLNHTAADCRAPRSPWSFGVTHDTPGPFRRRERPDPTSKPSPPKLALSPDVYVHDVRFAPARQALVAAHLHVATRDCQAVMTTNSIEGRCSAPPIGKAVPQNRPTTGPVAQAPPITLLASPAFAVDTRDHSHLPRRERRQMGRPPARVRPCVTIRGRG